MLIMVNGLDIYRSKQRKQALLTRNKEKELRSSEKNYKEGSQERENF